MRLDCVETDNYGKIFNFILDIFATNDIRMNGPNARRA